MPSRRPNLFVIGAMKCGTSSLHAYLGLHPEVFMSTPKEPSYFVDPKVLHEVWPEMAARGYWRSERAYLQLFEEAGAAAVIGESSTNYAKLRQVVDVPQRIAGFSPDARFVYVVRDPIRRTISHYLHEVRTGRERRDMLTAIRDHPEYVDVSHYAMQLNAYFEIFGRDCVKVVTTEELEAEPAATMRDLFAWLEVDCDFVPPNLRERKGATPARFQPFRPLARRMRGNRIWRALAPRLPISIRQAAHRLGRGPAVERDPASEAAVVRYLRSIQTAQVDELERTLNRRFPMWTTLYGDS